MYYSYQDILQYNAVYNFVIGSRGCGKSYGAKKLVINKFIRTGAQFIYLRRYKVELQKVQTFFDDVAGEFPDHKFKVRGKVFYIDDKIAGWAIPLQTSQIEKQNSYKGVKYIVFDEFLIDNVNSQYRYLKDEYFTMANFYSTVDRDRDSTVVLFIGNAISMQNPYFDEIGIRPASKIRVKYAVNSTGEKRALAAIEVFSDKDQVQKQRDTRFGLLTQDSDIDDFMHDNVFYLDDDSMIMEVPKNPKKYEYFLNIYFQGKRYQFLMILQGQTILMSTFVENPYVTYALKSSDITDGIPLIPQSIRDLLKSVLTRYSTMGCVAFDSQSTRQAYLNIQKALQIK